MVGCHILYRVISSYEVYQSFNKDLSIVLRKSRSIYTPKVIAKYMNDSANKYAKYVANINQTTKSRYDRFHDTIFANHPYFNVILQFFDLLIYKELYLAIKTYNTEPTPGILQIRRLESVTESAATIVVCTTYFIKEEGWLCFMYFFCFCFVSVCVCVCVSFTCVLVCLLVCMRFVG